LLTAHERAIGADADRFRVLLKGCDILVGQWVKLPLETHRQAAAIQTYSHRY
jgi:hypothetical protein